MPRANRYFLPHQVWHITHRCHQRATPYEPMWSESVAVGRREFVERVQDELGTRAQYREVVADGAAHVLREPPGVYAARFSGERAALRVKAPVVSD